MANNTRLNQNTTVGDDIATLDVGGIKHEQVINEFLVGGVPVMVDAANPLPTQDAAAGVSLASIDLKTTGTPTTILNGKTVVTVAGTRVVLAASTTVKSVTIKALAANTGLIFVGNATVAAANGFQLSAGDTVSMDISNLNTVNIDAATSGDSVTYLGVN